MTMLWTAYADDAGTKYGVQVEDQGNNMLNDLCASSSPAIVRVAPFGITYLTLPELLEQAGWSGAVAGGPGLITRKLALTVSDGYVSPLPSTALPPVPSFVPIGMLQVPVGDVAVFDALEPTGAAPFTNLMGIQLKQAGIFITGSSGESRNSN